MQAFYEDERGRRQAYRLFFFSPAWEAHDAALTWLKDVARPGEIVATSTPHWVYLKTGLLAVMPPFELDVRVAQRLIDSVPVRYLIIDSMDFVDISRRYGTPLVQTFPERWQLIYATPENESRIYRRVTAGEPSGAYSASR